MAGDSGLDLGQQGVRGEEEQMSGPIWAVEGGRSGMASPIQAGGGRQQAQSG